MEAARPTRRPLEPTWLERALRDYRVLMLDQRGTGRSTPVGPLVGLPPAEQAAYLSHFRADSIVRDAEVIRKSSASSSGACWGRASAGSASRHICRWPLKACGRHSSQADCLPSDSTRTRSTAARTRGCSSGTAVTTIAIPTIGSVCARCIAEGGLTLPSGDRLTSRRFQQLGFLLGMSDGAERLHYLLERPPDSPAFLHDVETALPFARNPIFCVLHESCYADGCSTRWSAERLRPREFDARAVHGGARLPWMLDDYGALRPLREAATSSRSANGRASTIQRSSSGTRSRLRLPSTPTTCTSTAPSRNGRPH